LSNRVCTYLDEERFMNDKLMGTVILVDEEKVYRVFRRIPSDFAHSRDFSLKQRGDFLDKGEKNAPLQMEIRGQDVPIKSIYS
jgi:hypothetical protein